MAGGYAAGISADSGGGGAAGAGAAGELVGAFALAIACALFLLAGAGRKEFRAGPVCLAGGLGYLLACFWLTPSFVRTIVFNWPTDSYAYQFGTAQGWLVAGLIAGVLLIRAAMGFRGRRSI